MNTKYNTHNESTFQTVAEPVAGYDTLTAPIHLDVTIEDNSMLGAVQKALQMIKGIASVRVTGVGQAKSIADPFAELDTTWGGDRDANDIAEELHAMRENSRSVEAW